MALVTTRAPLSCLERTSRVGTVAFDRAATLEAAVGNVRGALPGIGALRSAGHYTSKQASVRPVRARLFVHTVPTIRIREYRRRGG